MGPDEAFLAADAEDARAALAAAALVASSRGDVGLTDPAYEAWWLHLAEGGYRWLRERDSLAVVSIQITPGTPHKEGTTPVTTTFTLDDTDEVTFTLTGLDAKGAAVPLPSGYTAAWTLADPDNTGATLDASADTTSAVLAAGTPDNTGNLMVSVTVTITNADGSTSTLSGAEAVIVQATAATTVGLVAGTPAPETPAAPPAA